MKQPTIFERMRQDHRHVLDRLPVLESAAATPASASADWPGFEVREVLAMLARQFQTHMAAEDEVLYPALAEVLPEARPSIEPLQADHRTLRMMLSDLESGLREACSVARNELIAVQLRDLADLLRIHIRKEEAVVFGVAERALPPPEVQALAARIERGAAGPARPVPPQFRLWKGASS